MSEQYLVRTDDRIELEWQLNTHHAEGYDPISVAANTWLTGLVGTQQAKHYLVVLRLRYAPNRERVMLPPEWEEQADG